MQNGNGANSFMTAVEAAEQLGVSDTAVRKWIANGTIQANKHSREWRIPLSEVERLRQESNGTQPHRTNPSDKPNEQAERTSRTNTSHDSSPNLRPLELENQHLRREGEAALQRALSAENRLQSALNSISELTEQIDHLTQLLAMSQKTIQQMTDQNQLLLEDTRKKAPWWRRIFANGTSGSPPLHSDSDVDNQS